MDFTFRRLLQLSLLGSQPLATAQQKPAAGPPPIKTAIAIDSTTLSKDKPVKGGVKVDSNAIDVSVK